MQKKGNGDLFDYRIHVWKYGNVRLESDQKGTQTPRWSQTNKQSENLISTLVRILLVMFLTID